jgi:single-strand DNA-binding protein
MNTVILIGYLGSDAESRPTRNNSTLTVLSLATNRVWKDRETGERQSRTTWHRCVTFGPTATYAATLTRGAHVQIEGEMQTRGYVTKGGAKKSVTEVRVRRLTLLNRTQRVAAPEGAAA